jgi:ABC-2 type transport system ATP-binding protein
MNMDKILIVDGVTKEYPGRVAVEDISFSVARGSIHGFLGPNGAGKTTTMKMIAGLIPVTQGRITLFGEEASPTNLGMRNQLGILPENAPLFMDMTVTVYLSYVARLHQMRDIPRRVNEVIDALSLGEVRHRLIGNLSKGYKQRVGLAQALVYDAPFLILDEPTNGLDPQSVVELRDFIKGLAREKTVLFSSHILSEVEQLCDHITIIHQGRIRASGTIQEIHQRFRQGLVLKIGLAPGEALPDLAAFGSYQLVHHHRLNTEEQYQVCFAEERDVRSELVRFLVQQNRTLLTFTAESPELEDIFLHVTEKK